MMKIIPPGTLWHKSIWYPLFAMLLFASVAHSDDTEIFFSQAHGDPKHYPNFLFILDDSGSMGWGSRGGGTRMRAMQYAMQNIVNSVDNINIGMMNFSGSGGRLVYPVTAVSARGAAAGMSQVISSMRAQGGTPLTGALYEATLVMTGRGGYISPMTSECQNNHIIMLSDGAAGGNALAPQISNLIGRSCSGNQCAPELAKWLSTTDHVPAFRKKKNIKVSTVGFNISSSFLDDVAKAGGGKYYEANAASDLVDVFNEIITTVKDVEASFVAPVTSINQFNRMTQSNDLYFAMFKPQISPTWPGNLKRYALGHDGTSAIIVDANGKAAINPATGVFYDSATSFWSNVQDGSNVALGGAAGEMHSTKRRIYTHLGAIPTGGKFLTDRFVPSNAAVTSRLAGLSTSERVDLVNWFLGKDVKNEVENSNERLHMGGVLHSSPVSVNYGNGDTLIFIGTNEGFLHAVNKDTGAEQYSFIPQELIPNLVDFYKNKGGIERPNGLDGSITLLHEDDNKNAAVDGSEKAYLYVGMRRGGDDYYAFDISNPNKPKLMWRIDGGKGDFARLGQTWSKPIATKIYYKGNERNVLIFGGGYDTNQDPTKADASRAVTRTDTVGNSVFIVDAITGQRIWSAHDNINTISQRMRYSIPSDLRVIDINGDGYADRIYVGDMGGQLWRFDIKPYHQSSDRLGELVSGGVMANLNTGAFPVRFYNEPDAALISKDGKSFMSIGIGSGWRAHPLNDQVRDNFYMIRDNSPLATPEGYGKNEGGSWRPIEQRDLTDVTNSLSTERRNKTSDDGWLLQLSSKGEKNLSASVTVDSQVLFTTYALDPRPPIDVCSPPSGQGYAYALDVMNGDPILPLASGSSSSALTKQDRRTSLTTQSIPPRPAVIISELGGEVSTTVLVGTQMPFKNLPMPDLIKRTYWHNRHRGGNDTTPATCRAGSAALLSCR